MRIVIVRHGEPDYSIDSLTQKGWREAELLSERLVKMNIKDFYVSPLGRAQDTAKPTLEKLGVTAETLPWLEEFRGRMKPMENGRIWPWDIHYSQWENEPAVFSKDNWTNAYFYKDSNVPDVFDEMKKGTDELLARYGYKREKYGYSCKENLDITIALICHFGTGAVITGYLTGISPFMLWHGFFMPPSSVTTLVPDERVKGTVSFRCMQMGDTSHLYAAGEPVSKSGLMPEFYDPESPHKML